MTIVWIAPAAGQLTTLLELSYGEPVYQVTLEAESSDEMTPIVPIYYEMLLDEDGLGAPLDYKLIQTGTNIGTLQIVPIVREMDEYVPEYNRPENWTWDTEDTAGGNYATYGSALSGGKNFQFTIRAHNATGLATYTDSNGDLQYDLNDSNFTGTDYEDRTFSIYIFNNWSSDRDYFMLEYHEGRTINYDGVEYEPEDFLIAIKEDGYYD